ncbi:MAG: hypothetical protein IH600_16930 [Bacteroidetes bacterium]|nr:hypothetical protein [Bacteroidota bacterium]
MTIRPCIFPKSLSTGPSTVLSAVLFLLPLLSLCVYAQTGDTPAGISQPQVRETQLRETQLRTLEPQTPREWIFSIEGSATKLLDDFSDTRFSNGGALTLRRYVRNLGPGNGTLYGMVGLGFYDLQWKTDGQMISVFDTSQIRINEVYRSFAMPITLEALWRTRVGSEAELFLGGGLEFTYFSPMNSNGDALPKPQEKYGKWTVGIPLTAMLDYMLTDHFSITLQATLHPLFTDYLDGLRAGDWADVYLTTGIGITYSFPEPDGDRDYDGLSNREERNLYKSDPDNPDTDGDGLRDGEELAIGTSPLFADTDNDGLSDGEEVRHWGTDPLRKDSDSDGLADLEETVTGTNPLRADTDNDGLNDSVEYAHGTDPLRLDTDGDGLPDGLETVSSPLLRDTDGDGLDDGMETAYGLRSYDSDFDVDGLLDEMEVRIGTDPRKPDTDNDGATDYSEYFGLMTDPRNPDTDGDGIPDGTDPTPLPRSNYNPVQRLSWVFMEIFKRGNAVDETSKAFIQMLHLIRSAPRQHIYELEIQVFGKDMTEARARRSELEPFLRKLTTGWDIPIITVYETVEKTYNDARLRYIWNSGLGR